MASTKKGRTRGPKTKALPAALARRAVAASSAKIARLLDEATRDIALIKRRRAEIADAFYDIGEALVRLKRREVVAAMGCRSFAELCEKHVAISATQAERLIDIAENMTREAAIAVGSTKAASLVALARATPADDTAAQLMAHGVRVHGKKLDVAHASARAIATATAQVRTRAVKRGRSVSKSEHAEVHALVRRLADAGVDDARVIAKAGHVGAGARVAIDIAIADLPLLAKASRSGRG
jgi:hypothetical protein